MHSILWPCTEGSRELKGVYSPGTSQSCFLVLCRLQAQLLASESRVQELERSVQVQLNSLLNRLRAADMEPPRAFMSELAGLQTFAQGLEQRCKHLQDEAAATRRHAHLTCLSRSLHSPDTR